MNKRYDDLPEWVFNVEEVSANVFEVKGRNSFGNQVKAIGVNIDDLLQNCRNAAKELNIEKSKP